MINETETVAMGTAAGTAILMNAMDGNMIVSVATILISGVIAPLVKDFVDSRKQRRARRRMHEKINKKVEPLK